LPGFVPNIERIQARPFRNGLTLVGIPWQHYEFWLENALGNIFSPYCLLIPSNEKRTNRFMKTKDQRQGIQGNPQGDPMPYEQTFIPIIVLANAGSLPSLAPIFACYSLEKLSFLGHFTLG